MLNAATVSGIDMIESIQASGAEDGFLERWSGYQASVNKAKVRFENVNRFLGTLPQALQTVSNITVMILAFWSIMEGHFTAGMFLAFQGCMTAFLTPVNDLINAGQSIQEMRSSIERITDVMNYREECATREDFTEEEIAHAEKLSGTIEMKHVTFGYSPLGEPVIKDFSLTVTPGKRVAFVGASGCGKSTIAKLTGSLAMVDQDVVLFQDTIANNIRMWDKTIEDYDMILAARDADIHNDILSRKGGYEHMLEENGRNLSGGQRQRIEIARVLAGDPSIIIMDEATAALDASTEYDISNYIHDRGITSVIIAHRLSTIRDCDEIVVLDQGVVVQRGTHQELIREEGLYRRLVTA